MEPFSEAQRADAGVHARTLVVKSTTVRSEGGSPNALLVEGPPWGTPTRSRVLTRASLQQPMPTPLPPAPVHSTSAAAGYSHAAPPPRVAQRGTLSQPSSTVADAGRSLLLSAELRSLPPSFRARIRAELQRRDGDSARLLAENERLHTEVRRLNAELGELRASGGSPSVANKDGTIGTEAQPQVSSTRVEAATATRGKGSQPSLYDRNSDGSADEQKQATNPRARVVAPKTTEHCLSQL